jgi:hypothetical protein
MNISSSANMSQLNAVDTRGSTARQDYSVAVALKANEQVKQEGAAIEKLVESASAPVADDKRGQNLATYA